MGVLYAHLIGLRIIDYRFPVNDDLYGVVVSVGLGVVLLHGLMISWVGEQFRVADVDGMHYGD